MAKHKDDSNEYVDNKQLKDMPKRMPKAQVRLALGTSQKALAFKNSKPGDKDYFSASTPVKKYAQKYTITQLEKQVNYLEKLMKETTVKEMIRSMVKEMLVEKADEIDLNDVRKKAKQLGLKIKTSNVSWGYAATIYDTKTNLATKGIFKKSPEVDDFLGRVKELKDFVGKNTVMFKGEKVTGLQK